MYISRSICRILSVDDMFTIRYAHVLYMGCGRGMHVDGEPCLRVVEEGGVGLGTGVH